VVIMKAIDLFAGWGGFTLGAERAGIPVLWAANHWPLAVEAHALNHPSTKHACQDLRQANWLDLPAYDLLLASPACQGHSSASQPKRRRYHDELRATAWAVVDCAEQTAPRAVIVENVVDFMQWTLYPIWCDALRKLGYHLAEHVVVASWHGVPQRRTRVFITATRHDIKLELIRNPSETPVGPVIDWHDPKPDSPWRLVSDSTPMVKARVAKGRANHGRRFLTQHVTGHPGVGLDEPIRTITTKDQWCVVDGNRFRGLTKREVARTQGFPDDYSWPDTATRSDTIKGLGNAVPPPIAEMLVREVVERC
jgi:DNA (cytosine-5)-methyltransferase 1